MSVEILLKPSSIPRSKLVDATMQWLEGTTLGKLVFLWTECLVLRMSEVDQARILHTTGVTTNQAMFIEALCAKHSRFLIEIDTDKYIVNGVEEALVEPKKKPGAKRKAPASTQLALFDDAGATKPGDVWQAYKSQYFARYHIQPVSNATVMGQCKNLIDRVGQDAAIPVVRFYLTHNDQWYVKKMHPMGLCLSDAESLHTQMMSGKQMTQSAAQMTDRSQTTMEAARGAIERLKGNRR